MLKIVKVPALAMAIFGGFAVLTPGGANASGVNVYPSTDILGCVSFTTSISGGSRQIDACAANNQNVSPTNTAPASDARWYIKFTDCTPSCTVTTVYSQKVQSSRVAYNVATQTLTASLPAFPYGCLATMTLKGTGAPTPSPVIDTTPDILTSPSLFVGLQEGLNSSQRATASGSVCGYAIPAGATASLLSGYGLTATIGL